MASVGAVFSEMKFSVVPSNWRHSSGELAAAFIDPDPPHPGNVSARTPAPADCSASRRVRPPIGVVLPGPARIMLAGGPGGG